MKSIKFFIFFLAVLPSLLLCENTSKNLPDGFSIGIGGDYTWMSLSTPPTYSGSTGGVVGDFSYQSPDTIFGKFKSVFNTGSLKDSGAKSSDAELYFEGAIGYTLSAYANFHFIPFLGLGGEYLWDDKKNHDNFTSIDLKYRMLYILTGFKFAYLQNCWSIGLEAQCLPIFNQTLHIGGLTGARWELTNRVGAAVFFPLGVKLMNMLWMEFSPYYRFLPIGSSSVLELPSRNLNQWGLIVQFRITDL